MRSVVEEGTAVAVRELNRPAAGKTGTANEYRDAWFSGYTADFVATRVGGLRRPRRLGSGETGGRAALPIWLRLHAGGARGPARARLRGARRASCRCASTRPPACSRATPCPAGSSPSSRAPQPTAEAPPPGQVRPERLLPRGRQAGVSVQPRPRRAAAASLAVAAAASPRRSDRAAALASATAAAPRAHGGVPLHASRRRHAAAASWSSPARRRS